MNYRTVLGLLAIMMLAALMMSCSSKNEGDLPGPDQHGTSAFKLTVLDDTYFNGASAQSYTLKTTDYGDDVVVDINVKGAQDLKALFANLEYDPEQYRPMTSEPAPNVGSRDDFLVLNVLRDTGVVHYGQILANPAWRTGFSGNGLVAQVSFKKEPAVDLRTVSAPPNAPLSATDLAWDSGSSTLNWGYYSQGDYDQNGEVNGADLVPLAEHYLEAGVFAPTSVQSLIDGDQNTEINSADIVPIAENFLVVCLGGYDVFHSASPADYPAGGTKLDNVSFGAATGNTTTDRKQFSYVVTAPVADDWYWVRPSDGSTVGVASNIIGGNVAELPQLALTNPPASGTGTAANPYVMDLTTDYVLTLTDPAGPTDVSVDTNTVWNVNPTAAGSVVKGATAVLNVVDTFSGDFSISATYNGQPCNPTAIFCTVTPVVTGLEIYPDPADTDWPGTGAGTEADPFILGNTFTTEYSLLADDAVGTGGNLINVADLTWSAFPPFIVTWTADGTFQANQFTANYIFAQDTSTHNSNSLYVEVHSLPAS
jgi:hypothetical protein